jgi:hypothetical protein
VLDFADNHRGGQRGATEVNIVPPCRAQKGRLVKHAVFVRNDRITIVLGRQVLDGLRPSLAKGPVSQSVHWGIDRNVVLEQTTKRNWKGSGEEDRHRVVFVSFASSKVQSTQGILGGLAIIHTKRSGERDFTRVTKCHGETVLNSNMAGDQGNHRRQENSRSGQLDRDQLAQNIRNAANSKGMLVIGRVSDNLRSSEEHEMVAIGQHKLLASIAIQQCSHTTGRRNAFRVKEATEKSRVLRRRGDSKGRRHSLNRRGFSTVPSREALGGGCRKHGQKKDRKPQSKLILP